MGWTQWMLPRLLSRIGESVARDSAIVVAWLESHAGATSAAVRAASGAAPGISVSRFARVIITVGG